jgi:hypothetical protein
MSENGKVPLLLRILILSLWVLLLILLLQRDFFIKKLDLHETQVIAREKQTDFFGVYFRKERIGFVKNRLIPSPSGDSFSLYEDATLHLNIMGESHPIEMHITATLTDKLLLDTFTFQFTSPFYQMDASGMVEDQDVVLTMSSGKGIIKDIIHLKSRPFLPINHRAYLLKQELQIGDKLKIPYFDPLSLTGKDTVVEYNGLKKIHIHGRIHVLHHFTESFAGVRFNTWIDETGKVMKEESPAGFVFLAEPEFMATDIATKGKDILRSVSIPLQGIMPPLNGLSTLNYILTLPEGVELAVDKDRQRLTDNILTITLEKYPAGTLQACTGNEKELAATPYIQAQNKAIGELAYSLVDGIESPIEQVRILTTWVYDNLEKRPVLGIPDALTTLQTRRGDCNEHASLFAALARNVGIPARVAAGVTFHEGAFFYHAWNEVCLGNEWLSLDTTKNQIPADLTHIKFVEGEIEDMIQIGALIGKLQIEVLPSGPQQMEQR